MPAPTLTYEDLKALKPCAESLNVMARLKGSAKAWNGEKITAERARKAGATFEDIVWVASARAAIDKDVRRRLQLWLADCAARVLHIYEADYPADDRPRTAIIASRAFARGEIAEAAWAAATGAAWVAARAAWSDVATAAAWEAVRTVAWVAAIAAARAGARVAAMAAAMAAARVAARDAPSGAAWAAAWAAARHAEESWQFDRLIEWLSDSEPQELALCRL
jgi:hypothetical protein